MSIERILVRAAVLALALTSAITAAQTPTVVTDPPQFGPYNGTFLPDGLGLKIPIPDARDPILLADSPCSLFCWIRTSEPISAFEPVAGIGNTTAEYPRYLAIDAGKVVLWMGEDNQLAGKANLAPNQWHLVAASFDGVRFHLYADGQPAASGNLTLGGTNSVLQMAPPTGPGLSPGKHFGGLASFTLLRRALSEDEVHTLYVTRPDFSVVQFEEGSKPWPFQTRGQAGYRAPQDPAMLPQTRAAYSPAVALHRAPAGPSLSQTSADEWMLSGGWTLREAPKVDTDGEHLSTAAYDATGWMPATVPGTVLASLENKLTLIDAKDKTRILPAYYSDNYISLLPGKTRTIEVEYPASAAHGPAEITLRGWNAVAQVVPVK
jgi:hypothetical protein